MKDRKYKWVWHGEERLFEVGILADGSLHNPRGYPPDVVRACVLAANERRHERRSQSAKKAAGTRARRREQKVYEVVRRLQLGHKFGPARYCWICGKGLGDPESIGHGIGSDCWQEILKRMEQTAGGRS